MLAKIKKIIIKNKILSLILFFSFAAGLVYSFYFRIMPTVDAQHYDTVAMNILEKGEYKSDLSKSYEFDLALFLSGPGYEFFLAGIYYFFGHNYEVVWIIQALLHALSVFFLFKVCQRLFPISGKKIGLIAAILFGLHPDLIEISAMLMTETLYLFLTILCLWAFVYTYQSTKSAPSLLLGSVTALAILTRPTVVLFIPLMLFYYLYNRHYKSLGFFLLALGIFLAPWAIRNYIYYHQLILTTLTGSVNIWLGNTLQATGGQFFSAFNPANDYVRTHGLSSLKQKVSFEFWSFVFGHPFVFLKLCLWRTVRFFSLIRPMGFWFYQNGLGQVIFICSSGLAIIALFISGFSGILLSFKEKKFIFYYLIAMALSLPLVLILSVVQSRYRFQIYPFLAVFGGYSIYKYIWERQRTVKKSLWLAGGILVLLTSIDIFFSFSTVVERVIKFF